MEFLKNRTELLFWVGLAVLGLILLVWLVRPMSTRSRPSDKEMTPREARDADEEQQDEQKTAPETEPETEQKEKEDSKEAPREAAPLER